MPPEWVQKLYYQNYTICHASHGMPMCLTLQSIIHTQIFNLLQGSEIRLACLKLEIGKTENLLGVLMQGAN